MDLLMPHMDGADATLAIRQHYPHIQVIALTSFKEDDLIKQALAAGAIGYLLKNVTADELAEAIYAAHAGRPTLALEATQVGVEEIAQSTEGRWYIPLCVLGLLVSLSPWLLSPCLPVGRVANPRSPAYRTTKSLFRETTRRLFSRILEQVPIAATVIIAQKR